MHGHRVTACGLIDEIGIGICVFLSYLIALSRFLDTFVSPTLSFAESISVCSDLGGCLVYVLVIKVKCASDES